MPPPQLRVHAEVGVAFDRKGDLASFAGGIADPQSGRSVTINDPVPVETTYDSAFGIKLNGTVTGSTCNADGASGGSYASGIVSGTLSDGAGANKAPQKGDIVLKRVNDVPGATPQQLRWTIRSSTFVEKLGQAG